MEEINEYIILVVDSEGKRPLGRRRNSKHELKYRQCAGGPVDFTL
jgi:hypothetical protein